MNIFNVGNKSINLYLLDSGTHRLLIDTGFPNQLNELGRAMRQTGFKISDIDYLMVTHFHIDHAGAVQELKNEGVRFILFDMQIAHIKAMENLAASKWKYIPLQTADNIVLSAKNSRQFLQQINLQGEVIETPGHTDDSISLVLASGETFIGDLLAEHVIMEDISLARESWKTLRSAGAKVIYPGHGNIYELAFGSSKFK